MMGCAALHPPLSFTSLLFTAREVQLENSPIPFWRGAAHGDGVVGVTGQRNWALTRSR